MMLLETLKQEEVGSCGSGFSTKSFLSLSLSVFLWVSPQEFSFSEKHVMDTHTHVQGGARRFVVHSSTEISRVHPVDALKERTRLDIEEHLVTTFVALYVATQALLRLL